MRNVYTETKKIKKGRQPKRVSTTDAVRTY